MQTTEKKLEDISEIITGLPIQRYMKKEDTVGKKVIDNKSIDEIDQKFETFDVNIIKPACRQLGNILIGPAKDTKNITINKNMPKPITNITPNILSPH